jgi:hypothetical protein
MNNKFSEVFKPGTYPEMTYVSRHSKQTQYTYEERLKQSLAIDGYLTYIVGPSKIGKTVLCERVIGQKNMISMSGNDFSKEHDFWSGLGKKIGIPMTAEISEENSAFSENEQRATTITKNYFTTKDKVIDYFKKYGKVLILDDFHYAPPAIQYDIACQLKEVIRTGFKAIVISLPYRSDDAIRLNPDLTGRLSVIEIEPWKSDELKRIADKGFSKLNINVDDKIISRMADESIHSPQLMQSICLNIGLLTENHLEITNETVSESCRFACMNLPYGDVVRILKAGPPTRGQQRLRYELQDGSKRDIYSLILKVLADNPPSIQLTIGELMDRIRNNMTDNILKQQKVKDSLKNWKKLLETQGSLYHVLDWKDDTIYVLDNMFLFYIRWGI